MERKKTPYGIYKNIEDSDYFRVVDDYKFYFSSESYAYKFSQRVFETIEKNKKENFNKYKMEITPEITYAIYLYKIIEKRGFRVYHIDPITYTETRVAENPSIFSKQK